MLNKRNWDVHKFCSKDESRFSLSAIRVTPEATIATDGHRLMWLSLDGFTSESFPVVPNAAPAKDSFAPFLVSSDLAAKLSKATPSKEKIPVLNHAAVGIDGDRRTIAVTDLDTPQVFDATKQPEGSFPDTDRVMPKWDAATTRFCVNAEYLAQIAAFAAALDSKGTVSIVVSLYGDDNLKALRFDAEKDGQGMTAVLMPLRDHCTRDDRTWKQKDTDGIPFQIEWIQPANTYGYAAMVKAKTDADAAVEASWNTAHAEEIERAWELAHSEYLTRLSESDPFAQNKSYAEAAFTVRLVGDEEKTDEVEEESVTLYVNVPVSNAFVGKLGKILNVDVAQGDGDFINVYSARPAVIAHAIRELSLIGIVVTEVSPAERAPEGFIRNATPRERVAQRIPVNITDFMPKKIDARPINRLSSVNRDIADAANAF